MEPQCEICERCRTPTFSECDLRFVLKRRIGRTAGRRGLSCIDGSRARRPIMWSRDVFVAAWRRLEQAPQDELAWLLGIARGVIANRRRAESRQSALHERLAATAVLEFEPGPERRVGER